MEVVGASETARSVEVVGAFETARSVEVVGASEEISLSFGILNIAKMKVTMNTFCTGLLSQQEHVCQWI